MMFGDNQVTVEHKKDGWYISWKYTDRRILSLLDLADDAISRAEAVENKYNAAGGKKVKKSKGVRM